MKFEELKKQLLDLYEDFFADMKIDKKTGVVAGTNLRFTGFPYIGKNYCNAPIKILFIPLDVGEDECRKDDTYHTFEDRESIFPSGMLDFNAHIAGLYATALFILKDKMGLQSAWDALWKNRECKSARAIRLSCKSLPQDLMSYVAYDNRFRFVTIGRDKRTGGKDRIWINPEREARLLLDEIELFAPDIIVFQGEEGLWNCRVDELKKDYTVVVAYHPSCWQRGADKLQYIVDRIGPQLK